MELREINHLYWRAAFGASPNLIKKCREQSKSHVIDALLKVSLDNAPLYIDTTELDHYTGNDLLGSQLKRTAFFKKSRRLLLDFNTTWIKRITESPGNLRERMVLFWANHFVCKDNNIYHVMKFHNTIRTHALGNFGDFVKAISKEAAMLKYLNNKQNKKQKPNENFARELMELFTLGEGKYSEKDIKESARAFTGYNHNFEGEFVLRRFQHDYNYKSFFGRRGRYTGDDIIDIILQEKQCARYVCTKIYKYFVNPEINKAYVNQMADVFYKDYDIERLMRFVFMSDWFYDEQNQGSKIKSPVDLIVGLSQTVPIEFEEPTDLIKIQRVLGQTLLDPPNVAGWKGDKAWIDANTIMVRLKLPSLLLNNAMISLKEQGDFNDGFRAQFYNRIKNKLPFKTIPSWDSFMSNYSEIRTEDLPKFIIQGKVNKGTASYLRSLSKKSRRDFCVQLMSLPEYQMC